MKARIIAYLHVALLVAIVGCAVAAPERSAQNAASAHAPTERTPDMTTQASSPATPAPEDLLTKNDADFVAGFDRLYVQTWGDGAIPQKYKELSGVTLSVVTRCEACLTFHVRMAAKAGATGKEAIEAMRIGLLSGGSITIPTVRVGYKALLDLRLI